MTKNAITEKVLRDTQGRVHNYLRISVTDRCNFRCSYCMPQGGINAAAKEDLLSIEEIARLLRVFSSLGVEKVRFTGGEPFVRKGFEQFLAEKLAENPPYRIHLTSNASYFPEPKSNRGKHFSKIASLNVSLDSLKPEKFEEITGSNQFDRVMQNLQRIRACGIPVKINCVLQKGVNSDEIGDFVAFAQSQELCVRFIEPMPLNGSGKDAWKYISAEEILNLIKSKYELCPLPGPKSASSDLYRLKGGGIIGVIPAYSRTFCHNCNRLRIDARGILRTCLYAQQGCDLKKLMRDGAGDAELVLAIRKRLNQKEANGKIEEEKSKSYFSMSILGG